MAQREGSTDLDAALFGGAYVGLGKHLHVTDPGASALSRNSDSVDQRTGNDSDEQCKWAPGNICRLVGLTHDPSDTQLSLLNGTLATLRSRAADGRWEVQSQVGRRKLLPENLLVCWRDDPRGVLAPGFHGRKLLVTSLLVTLFVLFAAELTVQHMSALGMSSAAGVESDTDLKSQSYLIERSQIPGLPAAILAWVAPTCSFLWIVGTVGTCFKLHTPLRDPSTVCPPISELAVAPTSAKMLYRIGFAAAAALLAASVLLHQELSLPHLPGGRNGDAGIGCTHYGLLAAAGVAMQGVFVLEPRLSWQCCIHLLGAFIFFGGAWSYMSWAHKLYLPGSNQPPEDSPGWSESVAVAQDQADASALLGHPLVWSIVWLRHYILMRGPMALFLVPLVVQFAERAPANVALAASSSVRGSSGLVQWLLVLNFMLIFLSYAPEMAVAATLPYPLQDDV